MKQKLVISLLIGLIVGYFAGREHLKYELKSSATLAVETLRTGLTNAFSAFSNREQKQKSTSQTKAESDYIRDFLAVELISAKRSDALGRKNVFVEGRVKNKGNRTISRMTAIVYFRDKDGNNISEDKCYPVTVSAFDSEGPLKPNYERKLLSVPDDVPSAWNEGSVGIEIERIDFEVSDSSK